MQDAERLRHRQLRPPWPPVSPVEAKLLGGEPGCQEYLHHKKNTDVRLGINLHEDECVCVCICLYLYSCARVHQLSIVSVISMFEAGRNSPGTVESVSDPDSPDQKMGSPKLSKLSKLQKPNDEKISELDTWVCLKIGYIPNEIAI